MHDAILSKQAHNKKKPAVDRLPLSPPELSKLRYNVIFSKFQFSR